MNPNTAMANMNPMGGPVTGAPMPMMNNAAANQQAGAAAAARQQQMSDNQRGVLNTYIYEYFIRYGMYDCARALLNSDQQVNVLKDVAHRRDGGNAVNGVGDDPMDTDSKDDVDPKLPDDLPPPKLPIASDSSFLYEWFCLFWDIYNAQRAKGGNGAVNQYVAHTQDLLRQAHPNMTPLQYQQQMARMQNGNMNMAMKQTTLARTAAMAHAKQNHMQRDPSQADGNRDRPGSPASGENAPSPSAKRPRLDSGAFNGNQPGAMMPNGQGMPGQGPMTANANVASAHQMLLTHGINPSTLSAQQLNSFINSPPAARQKSIATYSQNLQQHQGKQMPNAAGPQNQGSPMVPQGPDANALNGFYNPGEMGPGGMRPGPGGGQATAGSNHALQDYQMQLMLLEQQNKKRLMMARQEQDNIGQQPGGPGAVGPNGQPFPDGSPQAMRTGASPNPTDQAKRGTPQMNNSGIPSPVPEAGQSRDSPNPGMNFMGNHVDPNAMQQPFFKNMEGMATQGQMNGMRPPSSHPGQQFSQQQMMAAARQQGAPGTPGQWQQGPNGQMVPQNMQQGQQMQGGAQRSMPPPSAPAAAAAANANNRTTASPQQPNAAPPTPNQSTKAAPKKKETKAQKEKRVAAQKKNQQNAANNAANADNATDQDTPAPATPMTPANPGPNKNGAAAGNNQTNTAAPATTAAAATTAPQTAPMPGQAQGDPNQANMMGDFSGMVDFGGMELANPLQSGDVLNDFDFDSFLHDGDGNNEPFDFNGAFSGMEGGEIGAE